MTNKYQGYLIDLDGTIYNGDLPIDSAIEFTNTLIKKNIPFKFVTNNATLSPEQFADKLNSLYNLSVTANHFYTSTDALIFYLKSHYTSNQKLYVVGEDALKNQLLKNEFQIVEDDSAEVVVQGLDRTTNYEKLSVAVRAINKGADFLVTNADRLIPAGYDKNPSSGAITHFISYATHKEPIIFGKPNSPIIDGALKKLNLSKDQVLLIGDNYETDIKAGINCGVDTLMVLTGVTTLSQANSFEIQPTYIMENLSYWRI